MQCLRTKTPYSISVSAPPKVELTARRTLSFLSGGDLVPLLGDILYPSEKELLAERLEFFI